MKYITRNQFNAMKPNLGGDFWNTWVLYDTAFTQFPDASLIGFKPLGTGLWAKINIDGKDYTIYS